MPRRALVGDDERHIVRLVEVNLRRCGYAVLTALDPETAFDLARVEQPDLIILDAGWALVAERLAADPLTRQIRVVLLGPGGLPDFDR